MGTVWLENHTVSPGFSRADGRAPDTARSAVLYGTTTLSPGKPIPGSPTPYKEKRTLPGTPADVSWFVCVAALAAEAPIVSVARFGNINPIPFR